MCSLLSYLCNAENTKVLTTFKLHADLCFTILFHVLKRKQENKDRSTKWIEIIYVCTQSKMFDFMKSVIAL